MQSIACTSEARARIPAEACKSVASDFGLRDDLFPGILISSTTYHWVVRMADKVTIKNQKY